MNGLHALNTEPVNLIRNLKKCFGPQAVLADVSFPDIVFTDVAVLGELKEYSTVAADAAKAAME